MKLKHLQTLAWLSLANLLLVGTHLAFAAPPPATERKSLNDTDREAFNPGPSPLEGSFETVRLRPGRVTLPKGAPVVSLDGEWKMVEGDDGDNPFSGLVNNLGVFDPLKITDKWDQPLADRWEKAIPAEVPGSVHAALVEAGRIPDPTFGKNVDIARKFSFKPYWFKRTFKLPEGFNDPRLVFGGVAVESRVWLNGILLGGHEGMFGGPDFDVRGILKDENTLIVEIKPIELQPRGGDATDSQCGGVNDSWVNTATFNNVYGWHYVNLPPLGIWRSVKIEGSPEVRMVHPFVATRDVQKGEIDLVVELDGKRNPVVGELVGVITPENFEGSSYNFAHDVKSSGSRTTARLRMQVPEPRLWWPNNMGAPNLYKLELSFVPEGGGVADTQDITFGIRTIEMQPFPEGMEPEYFPRMDFEGFYDWTFVVNGKPMFIKGTGWCTMDPLMDFSRERYERLIKLARDQHIQMFRAWGNGMPETDEFYDLCDRYGIMVYQEWPTGWNSHNWQPYHVLEDTVRRNMLRLRNHPSLVMWGGGNESNYPFGPAIDMMGRYATELDGTRPFHRTSPWGGAAHDYETDHGRNVLDKALEITSAFWGEFGMRSLPVYESVQRYLPDDEKNAWPPLKDGSFELHTPLFNRDGGDMARLQQFSGYFSDGKTMQDFIRGSQVASVTAVRHTLERSRTRWPAATGALYYKMNDNYPAASWACVDWYGAPKMNHYFFQQAFAPLHACLMFTRFDLSPVEGKFGNGFNLKPGKKSIDIPGDLAERPLTISLWVKLNSHGDNKILTAPGPTGAREWEVFTMPDTGALAMIVPGVGLVICDDTILEKDKWHHIALRLRKDGFELYADGRKVLDRRHILLIHDRPFVIGGNAIWHREMCDGTVDDILVERGARNLEGYVPSGPAQKAENTLLLVNFDDDERGSSFELPVYLLDDADALENAPWEVRVRVFDSRLKMVQSRTFEGRGAIDRVKKLGEFKPDREVLNSNPLLFVVEVLREGKQANRTFYWTNFEAVKDSLFDLPKTKCSFKAVGDSVVITNDGEVPAVAVSIERPGHADTFHASENFVWLDPGESKTVEVNATEGLKLEGWNL
jgi:beta-mannosidase